jgi:hypothetical protein
MRKIRWLVIPVLLLFTLACGLTSGIQNIQKSVSTQIPAILTSAPTEEGLIATAVEQQSSNPCSGTPTAGGLGLSVDTAKTVLLLTQQFTFTDGNVGGQQAVIASLTDAGATSFPAIANGFSAAFIGDPCNLSQIVVTIPRTDQQDTVDQGIGVSEILFSGLLPADVQLGFVTWMAENYGSVPVSGQQQTTFNTMQFTLMRTDTEMELTIDPAT